MKIYQEIGMQQVPDFGAALNGWLWPRLLPEHIDTCPQATLVGSGYPLSAHLTRHAPPHEDRLIFGAGTDGPEGGGYRPGPCDRIYCVRGPLTAQALGLPPGAAATDSAALAGRFVPTPTRKYSPFALMPSAAQIADKAWQSVCATLDIGFLDPRWPAERLLEGIGRSEVLLTETLHGAVVADALRVPWVAIATHDSLGSSFAWRDWCASLSVTYAPVPVLSL